MRTQQEILERIKGLNDVLGFQECDLISYLTFENARPFLKDGTTEKEWAPEELTREGILKRMLEYMPFAWEKANGFRGLSAGRSMAHYTAWVWLLGDEEVFGDLEDYEYYGKDNLVRICEHYGWNPDQWDDGVRRNSE